MARPRTTECAMKVSELSRRSGVPIPTIKYYIREGLLPAGERTAANQADYGPEHLERLALVRSLREVAGLGIATIKESLAALDRGVGEGGGAPALEVAMQALGLPLPGGAGREAEPGTGHALARARQRVDDLLDDLGWRVPPEARARADMAQALVAIERFWPDDVAPAVLREYGHIAEQLAVLEIPDTWNPGGDAADALRYAVTGTVLFETVVLALRRLAHIDRSRRLAAGRRG